MALCRNAGRKPRGSTPGAAQAARGHVFARRTARTIGGGVTYLVLRGREVRRVTRIAIADSERHGDYARINGTGRPGTQTACLGSSVGTRKACNR